MTPISNLLDQIINSSSPEKTLKEMSYYGLSDNEKSTLRKKDYEVYQGKVRELVKRGNDLYIYHTDRLTAFDKYIDMVPFKGAILSAISEFWLKEAEKVLPTHLQASPDPRVLKVKAMKPVKAEVIVRGYMAGSMMRAYEKGERFFCGASLPEGLTSWCKLPEVIITPTTKAAAFEHDEDATPDELIEQGVCTKSEWQEISKQALTLFSLGQEIYEKKGWILVDTKYEFGRDENGKIMIIDEVHTPDSSRLWVAKTWAEKTKAGQSPDMLDKEIVRRWLMEQGFKGEGDVPKVPTQILVDLAKVYLEVAETLIGQPVKCNEHTTPSPCLDIL